MPVELLGEEYGSGHLPRNQHNSVLQKGPSLVSIPKPSPDREQGRDLKREAGKTPALTAAQDTGETQYI